MQRISGRVGLALLSLLVIINTVGVRYMLWKIPASQSHFFASGLRFDFYQYFRGAALTVFILLLAVTALWHFAASGMRPAHDRSDLLLALYMAAVLLSFAFSPFKDSAAEGFVETYEGLSTLLAYGALAWLASVFLRGAEERRWMVAVFVICTGVVTAVSLLQSLGCDPIDWPLVRFYAQTPMTPYMSPDFRYGTTAHGLFSNPNYLSSYYSLFLPFLYGWMHGARKGIQTVAAWCAVTVCHLAIVASHSLSGLLLIAVGTGIYLILAGHRPTRSEGLKWHAAVWVPFSVALLAGGGDSWETAGAALLYTLLWLGWGLAERLQVPKIQVVLICTGVLGVAAGAAAFFYQAPSAPLSALSISGNRVDLTVDDSRYSLAIDTNQALASGPEGAQVIYDGDGAVTAGDSGFPFWLEERTFQGRKILLLMPFEIRLLSDGAGVSYLNAGYQTDKLDQSAVAGPIAIGRWGSSRLHIWQKTLPLILQRPIFGSGPDTFALVYPQNDVVNNIRFLSRPYLLVTKAHNTYLNLAVNLGLLGLIAYVAIQYRGIRRLWEHRSRGPYALQTVAALLLYALVGIANDSRVFLGVYQWILIGMAFAMIKHYEEEGRL